MGGRGAERGAAWHRALAPDGSAPSLASGSGSNCTSVASASCSRACASGVSRHDRATQATTSKAQASSARLRRPRDRRRACGRVGQADGDVVPRRGARGPARHTDPVLGANVAAVRPRRAITATTGPICSAPCVRTGASARASLCRRPIPMRWPCIWQRSAARRARRARRAGPGRRRLASAGEGCGAGQHQPAATPALLA